MFPEFGIINSSQQVGGIESTIAHIPNANPRPTSIQQKQQEKSITKLEVKFDMMIFVCPFSPKQLLEKVNHFLNYYYNYQF